MSGTTIINRNDAPFNNYIRNTTTALQAVPEPPEPPVTTWQRLGLTLTQNDQWLQYRDNWVTIYEKYTDEAKRTKAVTDDKNDLKKDFITFATPLLIGMSVRPELTNDDRVTFNLAVRDTSPTSRPAILTSPGVKLLVLEGRKVQVECRVVADSSRPSKHVDCDVVEYRHWFATAVAAPDPGTPTPPASAATPPVKVVGESGKAKFIVQLAETDAGKVINIEARWKNSKDNSKSGPWSPPATIMVAW